jgi:ribosomal protein S18 acetylase RimI-like enzyme
MVSFFSICRSYAYNHTLWSVIQPEDARMDCPKQLLPMTATVTQATPADLAAVVALTEAAYRPYTELLGAPPLPVTADYTAPIAAGQVWLRRTPSGLAGLLVLEFHPDHAMIESVAVAPHAQGQGHGVALLRLAENLARDAGLTELRLYTNARMERNIALYLGFGYRETGRRPNPHRPGWTVVDMAKTLPSVAGTGEG